MSQAPTPRGPLGQLLDDAKDASEKEWREIEADSGIPLATIQSWTSGRVAEPPLRGVLHLAKHLGVSPQAVMDRALEGYVPPLRARANGEGAAADVADAARVLDPAAPPERKPPQPTRRSRKSSQPSPEE